MVLTKEYRIPLPLTVEEYRIAQLYTIMKKSRNESTGSGSRVEILENVPYTDGPGGSGQYTKKIYHIGSHIPGWIKAFLPKTALRVEEEAWNAYPYTKTHTTCPFMDKFYIDVETYYYPDPGIQENVFNFSPDERKRISVDLIDPVKDPFPSNYYKKEEDPKIFASEKTKRGPLTEDWLDAYEKDVTKQPIMCAYKLISVEFKYWGIQSKIEQFIQDSARKTVLVGHRQAWSWQDEWCSFSIDDIRKFEAQVQKDLNTTQCESLGKETSERRETNERRRSLKADLSLYANSPKAVKQISEQSTEEIILGLRLTGIEEGSESSYDSSESDDEYLDALEDLDDEIGKFKATSPARRLDSSSLSSTILNEHVEDPALEHRLDMDLQQQAAEKRSDSSTPQSVLLLVIHGGGVADVESDQYPKARDFKTFQSVFSSTASLLYPSAERATALRLVECPPVCPQIIEHLKRISVFNEENAPSSEHSWLPPTFPISCIPLLLVSTLEFYRGVDCVINEANTIFKQFLETSDIPKEAVKVSILADSIGALFAYGALCSQTSGNADVASVDSLLVNYTGDNQSEGTSISDLHPGKLSSIGRSMSTDSAPLSQYSLVRNHKQFEFDVTNFFCCGSPIGMILMKQFFESNGSLPLTPVCSQVFNLFLPFDPVASRLEPLIDQSYSTVEPVHVPRYQSFPFNTEILYNNYNKHPVVSAMDARDPHSPCTPTLMASRKESSNGFGSNSSVDTIGPSSRIIDNGIWWGSKRIDYMLYCPDGLQQFPFSALTPLCYSSYWESRDMVSFILWQIIDEGLAARSDSISFGTGLFQPVVQREKWLKKRTSLKIKNMHPNHRANDVIAVENTSFKIVGKFVYGPIEVAALTGEKVDVYVSLHRQMENWKLSGSGITDNHGRLEFPVSISEAFPLGIHAIKMVVRGDYSAVDCNLAVVPRHTEAVVFSIDGSFLAAYSLRAIDPKIRGGAVDVVRHWQELGFLIIYVTSRLLFQKHQVTRWLAQHNFPFGMVSFCESINKDYQKHKQLFLRGLLAKEAINIHAAYGSSRDIHIFTSLGLTKEQIFIVGKQQKQKAAANFQVISDGYASHLSNLPSHPLSRHAVGPLCSLLPWTCFGIPASNTKPNRQQKSSSGRFRVFSKSKSQQPEEEADGSIKSDTQVAVRVRASSRLSPRR